MKQLLLAFIWLRWRLLVNAFRGTRRRDALERISRAGSALVPIVLMILMIPVLLALGGLALWAGWVMGEAGAPSRVFLAVARLALGGLFLVLVIGPVIQSIKGPETAYVRFVLLPIPRRLLHAIDLVSELADPWIFVVVPPVLLLPCGLLAAGAIRAAGFALAAGVLFVACFLTLASCLTNVLQWVFRERRRAEVATILIIVALSLSGVLPSLFAKRFEHHLLGGRGGDAPGTAAPGPGGAPSSGLSWTLALPSELYVRAVASGFEGGPILVALGALAGLALASVVFYTLSWTAFVRLLETPSGGRSRAAGGTLRAPSFRLPLLGGTAGAVAIAQLKSYLRTVNGKMAVFFSPVIVVAVALVMTRTRFEGEFRFSIPRGPGIALFFILMSFLGIQNLMANQFALDGAGLTLLFLTPLTDRDLVIGKMVANGLVIGGMALLYTALAAVFFPGGPLLLWPLPTLATVAVFVLVAPTAAILSVVLPKSVNLNKLGHAAQPNQLALMAMFFSMLVALGPVALAAALGYFVVGSPLATLALVGAWTGVALLASWPLVLLAARMLGARRENLAMVAQGR